MHNEASTSCEPLLVDVSLVEVWNSVREPGIFDIPIAARASPGGRIPSRKQKGQVEP